jgi:hypothetical protein
MGPDQSGGDLLGRLLLHQPAGELAILLLDLDRLEQGGEQPLAVAPADLLGRRRLDPLASIRAPRSTDLDPLAARIGDDQHRDALAPGPAGAAGAVLQRLGVARQLDMDDEREIGQVDAAGGDVGRDAAPGRAVAQRLQRLVALVLAMLARQSDGAEAALGQAGVEPADGSRVAQNRRALSASWKRAG